jgi:hypothetical protein
MREEDEGNTLIKKGNGFFWGLLCLILGLAFLCNAIFDIDLFSMSNLWPLFVLVPGLCFEATYFTTRKAPALLVPGGILTVIGLLFFFEIATGWVFAEYTWPVYILATAAGLFQLYLFGGKPKGLLLVISILAIVAGTSFLVMILGALVHVAGYNFIMPLTLIVIGAFIIITSIRRRY